MNVVDKVLYRKFKMPNKNNSYHCRYFSKREIKETLKQIIEGQRVLPKYTEYFDDDDQKRVQAVQSFCDDILKQLGAKSHE
jgi:hypothetical protein